MADDRPVLIAPSVLPADFSRLGDECRALEEAGVDRIQFDVMDGRFVPNLTFGPDVIAALRPHVSVPFEAHLMVEEPDLLAARYVAAGCERLIVHTEACPHLHRTLGNIAELGAKAAVAVNPATPISAFTHVLDLVDLVLVMTVNPGFGGQSFIHECLPKIQQASEWRREKNLRYRVEVDGGINNETIAECAGAGADTFVAGTALFGQRNMKAAVARMQKIADAHDPGLADLKI